MRYSFTPDLFANQNQNARYEGYDSHHDSADPDVKKRGDPNENQIDRKQQHSNVLCHKRSF
jgi:hypothetical protein